jgi:hypothetical protein
MNVGDLTEHYRKLNDNELLQLTLEFNDLTDGAQFALEAELRARNLPTPERMRKFVSLENETLIGKKAIQDGGPGRFRLWLPWGIGYMNFGKADRRRYVNSKTQEYTTTMFFLLLWFPLIPVKTYRVEDRGWKLVWLERLPLDWRQVRRVWATAGGLILSFILLLAGMWVVGYIRRM